MNNPPRLSVGSHEKGSGKGCAMNVVSWENGDRKITDFPECADRFLARVVQRFNDNYCIHRQNDLICASCSVIILKFAHRTVGTSLLTSHSPRARVEIYAKIARTEVFYAVDAVDAAYFAFAFAAASAASAAAADTFAFAATDTFAAVADAQFLIEQIERIFTQFEAFSGIKAQETPASKTEEAVAKMLKVSI